MAESIPEISVIIPAYNAAETITCQLHALVSEETESRIEIIVVDNGSNDGTDAVVEGFTGSSPEVALVSAPEIPGAGYARNRGVSVSKGQYLLFCDSDDLICTGWINAHVATLKHSDISLGVVRTSRGPCTSSGFDLPFPIDVPRFGPYPRLSGGNFGIRRDAFDVLGGFDIKLLTGQDAELGVRAYEADLRLAVSPNAKLLRGVAAAPMSRFRRSYQYGRGRRMICRKHPLFPRPDFLKDGWFLISRAPIAALRKAHRDAWLTTVGADLGYIRGAFSSNQEQLNR